MTQTELFADRMLRSLELVKQTLADFSDADMFVRPAPGANHATWQLGHIVASESRILAAGTGKPVDLPAGFAEKFTRETAASDDPSAFPTKAVLLDTFVKLRQTASQWARSLTPEQMQQPGPERIQRLAPTVGHLPSLIAEHTAMHVGQFQVIRRKLGKPVLF